LPGQSAISRRRCSRISPRRSAFLRSLCDAHLKEGALLVLGAFAIELAADPLDANSAAPRTSTAMTATSGTNFMAFLR
jgi:hypothetical protein